jgi:hypothetical protein
MSHLFNKVPTEAEIHSLRRRAILQGFDSEDSTQPDSKENPNRAYFGFEYIVTREEAWAACLLHGGCSAPEIGYNNTSENLSFGRKTSSERKESDKYTIKADSERTHGVFIVHPKILSSLQSETHELLLETTVKNQKWNDCNYYQGMNEILGIIQRQFMSNKHLVRFLWTNIYEKHLL